MKMLSSYINNFWWKMCRIKLIWFFYVKSLSMIVDSCYLNVFYCSIVLPKQHRELFFYLILLKSSPWFLLLLKLWLASFRHPIAESTVCDCWMSACCFAYTLNPSEYSKIYFKSILELLKNSTEMLFGWKLFWKWWELNDFLPF